MIQPNVLEQLAGQMEKVLTIAIWKLHGTNPVAITATDLEKFLAEFGIGNGKEPRLIVRGTENGLFLQVLPEDKAMEYIAKYEAANMGAVVRSQTKES